jgi:hypothetical protein
MKGNAVIAPPREPFGELARGPFSAAFIKQDFARIVRRRAKESGSFSPHVARRLPFDFDEIETLKADLPASLRSAL